MNSKSLISVLALFIPIPRSSFNPDEVVLSNSVLQYLQPSISKLVEVRRTGVAGWTSTIVQPLRLADPIVMVMP